MPANRNTFLFNGDIGPIAEYDKALLMLARRKPKNSLEKGELYLDATIIFMEKILEVCARERISSNVTSEMQEAQLTYDDLTVLKENLRVEPRSKIPWKAISYNIRTRRFMEMAEDLFLAAKRTSNSLRRSYICIPSEEMSPATNESIDPGERPAGYFVNLDAPATDENTENPFDDRFMAMHSTTSLAQSIASLMASSSSLAPLMDEHNNMDDEQSNNSESAPENASSDVRQSKRRFTIFQLFLNSIIANNSSVSNPTVNNGGSNNTGARATGVATSSPS
ncbi:hypothetical protein BJ138DRAFT_1160078 [Hygrophoropsis aurantiaca]|uniref:Uncharacterized protein n=1 Tax=Hygrophoropsis aurantiaca TaxID=72124 RepID=A0ACB8A1Q5_9AGAM|nr:hypothetical protein BJ138DRAFT_1160078 [Hygrophoropsis aurantiaca]